MEIYAKNKEDKCIGKYRKSAEIEVRKWEYAVPVGRNERPGNEGKWSTSDEKGSRKAEKQERK